MKVDLSHFLKLKTHLKWVKSLIKAKIIKPYVLSTLC